MGAQVHGLLQLPDGVLLATGCGVVDGQQAARPHVLRHVLELLLEDRDGPRAQPLAVLAPPRPSKIVATILVARLRSR